MDLTKDRSYNAAGVTQEHSLSAWEQIKQKASNFLGVAQHKTNETADAAQKKADEAGDQAASTWDAAKKSVSNTAQDAENRLSSTWQSTKEKTSQSVDEAKYQVGSTWDSTKEEARATTDATHDKSHEQRKEPLIDLQGLKETASQFLGVNQDKKPSDVENDAKQGTGEAGAGVKQSASQFLEAGKNETADAFGEINKNTLSESTAGVPHPMAEHAGLVWDSTKDESYSKDYHSGPELNWADIKRKASQLLEGASNETADTFDGVADRKTLSESTLGATQDDAHAATAPIDPTHAKTKAEEYHTPIVTKGVDWDVLKQKASQILESFGNETADTFDTVQDRKVSSESIAGVAAHKAEAASSPLDQTESKTSVTEKVQDASGSIEQRIQEARDKAARSAQEGRDEAAAQMKSGGLSWDTLKQKATSVLNSIQQTSHNAADSAHEQGHNVANSAQEQASKAGNDNTSAVKDANMRKVADIAGVASDRASAGEAKFDEPVFTSETRRATADQVADYAVK